MSLSGGLKQQIQYIFGFLNCFFSEKEKITSIFFIKDAFCNVLLLFFTEDVAADYQLWEKFSPNCY